MELPVFKELQSDYEELISCFILYPIWTTVARGNLAYPESEEDQEKVLDKLEKEMIQGMIRMECHYTTRHLHYPDTRLQPVLPPG